MFDSMKLIKIGEKCFYHEHIEVFKQKQHARSKEYAELNNVYIDVRNKNIENF